MRRALEPRRQSTRLPGANRSQRWASQLLRHRTRLSMRHRLARQAIRRVRETEKKQSRKLLKVPAASTDTTLSWCSQRLGLLRSQGLLPFERRRTPGPRETTTLSRTSPPGPMQRQQGPAPEPLVAIECTTDRGAYIKTCNSFLLVSTSRPRWKHSYKYSF